MARLRSKVALITGAGSGFGEAMAHAFTAAGALVLIADINSSAGQRVAADIAAKAYASAAAAPVFVRLDVTVKADWEAALETALATFGALDVVVNNAGTTYTKKPSVEVEEDEFDVVVNVNQKSVFWSVKVLMPYFVERGKGVVINTSSVAGTKVRPGQVWYGGTKGFVNTVTQGLAAEYGPCGVRVNSICPLRSATGLLEKFSGVPDSPEERARFGKSVPLGRMSDPMDVAMAAVFLASDEAAFISGVNLPVDGGRLAV